jgi:hypothetical protein
MGSNASTMRRGDPRLSEAFADVEGHRQAEEKAAKKKKGLAKIWKIVTGQSRAAGSRAPDRTRSLERADDEDGPLAPPPPLTYLMSRSKGDPPRHAPAPSSASGSTGYGLASPGMCASPATAPSSLLPSPVSSRKSGPDVEHEGIPFALDERTAALQNSRTMLSEPDMREYRSSTLFVPNTDPSGRPPPIKREKSLPPLPHELGGHQPRSFAATLAESRPATMFYDSRGMGMSTSPESPGAYGLGPPQAPFRTADTRRQSFGGMSSRPDLGLHTLPVSAGGGYAGNGNAQQFERASPQPYGEFGMSRRSLGRLDDMTSYESAQTAPRKRRSKFGLSSLFGKKGNGGHGKDQSHSGPLPAQGHAYPHEFPMHPGSSMSHDVGSVRGRTTSMVPRMSVASRKAIEELVEQDREFVAYRYPSNDPTFGLSR